MPVHLQPLHNLVRLRIFAVVSRMEAFIYSLTLFAPAVQSIVCAAIGVELDQ